jgi:hypothetical protein
VDEFSEMRGTRGTEIMALARALQAPEMETTGSSRGQTAIMPGTTAANAHGDAGSIDLQFEQITRQSAYQVSLYHANEAVLKKAAADTRAAAKETTAAAKASKTSRS